MPPTRVYSSERQRIADANHETTAPWEGDLLGPLTELTALNLRAELMRLVLE